MNFLVSITKTLLTPLCPRPTKIFEYFASVQRDGAYFMKPVDLMRAVVPVFQPYGEARGRDPASDLSRKRPSQRSCLERRLHNEVQACALSSFQHPIPAGYFAVAVPDAVLFCRLAGSQSMRNGNLPGESKEAIATSDVRDVTWRRVPSFVSRSGCGMSLRLTACSSASPGSLSSLR